jgi:YgiT-type zinc finger domain-containing protein
MKCSIQGCPGQYEQKRIVHTVDRKGQVIVFHNVPAEVCSVCGDTIFAPQTVRHLEELLAGEARPGQFVPMYEYA